MRLRKLFFISSLSSLCSVILWCFGLGHFVWCSSRGKTAQNNSIVGYSSMRADKLTANGLFDPTERRDAPLFQRPYVWNEQDNWKPLAESILALCKKRLEGKSVRPHFLGAVVLDQVRTPAGKVHTREVIDGQQRLTTLQLALASARDLCLELGQNKYSDAFRRLTSNDVPLSEDPDDLFQALAD